MQTVLITGANGFVGLYLSQLLVGRYKVVATGKGECRLNINHPHFIYQPLDFTHEKNISEVMQQYQPGIIVHAGALSKPDECELDKELAYSTNTIATQHLIKHAAAYKSFFLFISTDFIFDGKVGMYVEEDNPAPVNYYGQTKLLAESAVKNYPFHWSIVRTVLVYGQQQSGRQNILTTVANTLQRGAVYSVFNDQVRTPTYVEDLTGAIETILDQKATGVYHISGKDIRTPYEMAIATAQYLGLNESLIKKVTAETFQQPALRPLKTGFNISKAERALNYKPMSFEEGLKKTFQDFKMQQ